MLEAIKRGSTGWVAKILLAVLVFSFAIWGVADVFTGWGRGSIAKVGDHEIRVEDFQRAFQNELRNIQNRAGRRISTEDARAAGLDDRMSRYLAWQLVYIATGGTAMLVVDHDTDFMFELCDRIIVMDQGRIIAEGTPEEVRADPLVVDAYLGERVRPPRWGAPS